MATYCVTFAEPVTYLPNHPIGQKVIASLLVAGAEDEEAAKIHAIRVVSGNVRGLTATQVEG